MANPNKARAAKPAPEVVPSKGVTEAMPVSGVFPDEVSGEVDKHRVDTLTQIAAVMLPSAEKEEEKPTAGTNESERFLISSLPQHLREAIVESRKMGGSATSAAWLVAALEQDKKDLEIGAERWKTAMLSKIARILDKKYPDMDLSTSQQKGVRKDHLLADKLIAKIEKTTLEQKMDKSFTKRLQAEIDRFAEKISVKASGDPQRPNNPKREIAKEILKRPGPEELGEQ